MTRRARFWLVVGGVLFVGINFGGAVFAALQREPLHASVHAALALLGVYGFWWLASGREARRLRRAGAVPAAMAGELAERLNDLEQSVDAVAIEVERIGEGQRYLARLFGETGAPRPHVNGAATPGGLDARQRAPDDRRDRG